MKIKSLWFYILSVFLNIVAIFSFAAGNHHGTAVIWLCFGVCFLCLGAALSRKEQETNHADDPSEHDEVKDEDSTEAQ